MARPRSIPQPRTSFYLGMEGSALRNGSTWLESEHFCYPHGRMTRKALCICEDRQLHIVTCGLPDTYSSIPAFRVIKGKRVKGYISSDESGLHFKAFSLSSSNPSTPSESKESK